MSGKSKAAAGSRKLILAIVFILVVNLSLGFLLTRQSGGALTALMHTRMLDVSNTAAAMLDGDALARLTPADEGTPDYEAVMRTLGVFQDSIALQYIYCVRDMGDGTFTFGLDPTVADPGTFGEPVVVTPALVSAGHGTAAADQEAYTDAWGTFYSAYSPVFASDGAVAGIVAVDFSADWYNTELTTLVRTTAVVAAVSLLAGAAIVLLLSAWQRKELHAVHSQMNVLAKNVSVLLRGMDDLTHRPGRAEEPVLTDGEDLNDLGEKILAMERELEDRIARFHRQAYRDGLTGVRNSAAYQETVEGLEAGETPYALAIFDLNGLKTINDNGGHACGDAALRDAAGVLAEVFGLDAVYRVGGDEYVVLLPEAREEDLREAFARVEAAVAEANRGARGYDEPLGLSKGYAIRRDGETYSEVFRRADERMYAEKAAHYQVHGPR